MKFSAVREIEIFFIMQDFNDVGEIREIFFEKLVLTSQ